MGVIPGDTGAMSYEVIRVETDSTIYDLYSPSLLLPLFIIYHNIHNVCYTCVLHIMLNNVILQRNLKEKPFIIIIDKIWSFTIQNLMNYFSL